MLGSHNPVVKLPTKTVSDYIKQQLHGVTLQSCRHTGANLNLQKWGEMISVSEHLGHKGQNTSLLYLDAWKSNVNVEKLVQACQQMMFRQFPGIEAAVCSS